MVFFFQNICLKFRSRHSSISSRYSSRVRQLFFYGLLRLQLPHEFISNKYQTTSSRFPPSNLSIPAKYLEKDLTHFELVSALSSVKGKTPGHDRISYPIIKKLPLPILSLLLNIYNNIFSTGIYPQAWKTSLIVPILKPGKSPLDVCSYRPISLLPCLGKLLEKMIATRLSWYACKNDFIHHNQVPFKRGQGTIDSLVHLDHYISNALTNKNHISLMPLDFLKAFDRIGIHIVLRQLTKWKVGPRILNFIKSFLSHRKRSVLISNTRSSILPLDNGTP